MSTKPEDLIENPAEAVDIDAATDRIGEDLFGRDDDETDRKPAGEGEDESGVTDPLDKPPPQQSDEEKAAAEAAEAEKNSPEVQATGAPETWTKEALVEWAKIPERAQQEILKREADMMTGLETYKERASLGERYDTVVEPYRAALTAQNVDPVQLFQSFAGNHYLLTFGTPEQKHQIAANLVKTYNLDLNAINGLLGDRPQVAPEIQALMNEINGLKTNLSQRDQQTQSQQLATIEAEVAAFAADPKNQYFNEVAGDIKSLIDGRAATSLQDAYDKAVWANPTTRAKELARLQTESQTEAQRVAAERAAAAKKAQSADVRTSPTNRSGTASVGTIDDTLRETMADIEARA